eukprot:GHVN01020208.1.p1 GENE.GHVN01020208.1~~GHVN01020208.1.p1  ORF type:complete len:322 (-),score=24.73 GHVN01020208.1:1415-2380(-)
MQSQRILRLAEKVCMCIQEFCKGCSYGPGYVAAAKMLKSLQQKLWDDSSLSGCQIPGIGDAYITRLGACRMSTLDDIGRASVMSLAKATQLKEGTCHPWGDYSRSLPRFVLFSEKKGNMLNLTVRPFTLSGPPNAQGVKACPVDSPHISYHLIAYGETGEILVDRALHPQVPPLTITIENPFGMVTCELICRQLVGLDTKLNVGSPLVACGVPFDTTAVNPPSTAQHQRRKRSYPEDGRTEPTSMPPSKSLNTQQEKRVQAGSNTWDATPLQYDKSRFQYFAGGEDGKCCNGAIIRHERSQLAQQANLVDGLVDCMGLDFL